MGNNIKINYSTLDNNPWNALNILDRWYSTVKLPRFGKNTDTSAIAK